MTPSTHLAGAALLLGALMLPAACPGQEGTLDEFRVKRQDIYEFAEKPTVRCDGDKVTIRFASKACCDATVAIQDADGRIVRHLASGVLGPNAPEPFAKNSLAQTIVWDSKDDRDRYVTDRAALTARVSLGLRPRFERTLFWDPRRRMGSWSGEALLINTPTPLIRAAAEGVYVFEGRGLDRLQLFDHQGRYLRTIYPFPADRLAKVRGLDWYTFPQDGLRFPLRAGYAQATFLTSGSSAVRPGGAHGGGPSTFGSAATAMDVRDGRIALVFTRLNRLSADGATGGLPLEGPAVSFPQPNPYDRRLGPVQVGPTSAAFSPDGRWVYMTGYLWGCAMHVNNSAHYHKCLQGVTRIPFDGKGEMTTFAGTLAPDARGGGPGQFDDPVGVACDGQGRVYVADHMNDRVQVFSPEGRFLKAIAANKPTRVRIDPATGGIYVFSWGLATEHMARVLNDTRVVVPATLTRFKSFDDPRRLAAWPLPLGTRLRPYVERPPLASNFGGLEHYVELDFHTTPTTLWLVDTPGDLDIRGAGIRRYALKEEGFVELQDFSADALKSLGKSRLPAFWRQRLYADPANGRVYLAEGHSGPLGKMFHEMVELDPATWRPRLIQIPFDADDIAFDRDGLMSIRDYLVVGRFDPANNWREVPWDYGEERKNVSADFDSGRRTADLISAIPLYSGTLLQKGGMSLSPRGHLVVSCYVTKDVPAPVDKRTDEKPVSLDGNPTRRLPGADEKAWPKGSLYTPRFFPGRYYWGEVHIFDEHGRMLYDDAAPGITEMFGVAIDRDDNVYLLATLTRMIDGKPYHNIKTGTLMKFTPQKARVVTDSARGNVPVRLGAADRPTTQPEATLYGGNFWAQGAQWLYGGVGFCGKNVLCSCWNCRFALDDFARSFVPEVDRCRVAVLDSNGNLILRVGRYGNIDDGLPLIRDGGPADPHAVGGDEVALSYAPYLATLTDSRLFIADPGNGRILSVKLDYHATETVLLRPSPPGSQ
ncbi:MAG: hypothetical protein BIFFINMI_01471 [Phycisphaerae bacterium]|nr:hypothetical protein [Phycisphaerae bacterium]